MAKLDRSRPFGEVFGEHPDHKYVQDGKKFDHQGDEIGGKPEKAAKPVLSLKNDKPAPDDQVGAQLSE